MAALRTAGEARGFADGAALTGACAGFGAGLGAAFLGLGFRRFFLRSGGGRGGFSVCCKDNKVKRQWP